MNNAHAWNSFVLVAILTLGGVACGDRGEQGPAGPPADRTKMYCRTTGDILNVSTSKSTVSASCESERDMPWSGGCWAEDVPPGVYLAVDQPTDWDNINIAASWTCTWDASGAAPNLNFGVRAEMCCYRLETDQ